MNPDDPRDSVLVRVTSETIDASQALAFVGDPGAGGICVFVGTVRDRSHTGEPVTGLVYEAWDELAVVRLRELADEMRAKWSLRRAVILHRKGDLAVGDVSVVIACSAPHRPEAFAACRHGIERLKQEVPIWKKEILASGESDWVMGS